MQAFRNWIRQEVAALDWTQIRVKTGSGRRDRSRTKRQNQARAVN
jgi:hypothetical protein